MRLIIVFFIASLMPGILVAQTWQYAGGNTTFSGNVGIGFAPNYKLHVSGTGTFQQDQNGITGLNVINEDVTNSTSMARLFARNGTAKGSLQAIGSGSGGVYIGSESNHNVFFRSNSMNQMTILTNGNIGIGTTSPVAKFAVSLYGNTWSGNLKAVRITSPDNDYYMDVNTYIASSGNVGYQFSPNGNTGMVITTKGDVGIGTTTPPARLTVNMLNSNGWSGNLKVLRVSSPDNDYYLDVNTYIASSGNVGYQFSPNGNTGMVITTTGNIGIGTIIPDTKLTVKGVIHTNEVRVDVNAPIAPDYVFEKDYNLLPLAEVETYVNQNKHLPEVPSAKEMEENGLNLKEMNLLLLKKVEELTLHLIEQHKNDQLQQSQIDKLKEENRSLQVKIDNILKN